MHLRLSQVTGSALIAAIVLGVSPARAGAQDDSSFLGRLFRGGSSSSNSSSSARPSAGNPYGRQSSATAGGGQPANPHSPMTGSNYGGLNGTPVTTPPVAANGPAQRITPRPRSSPAVTNADPLLTRLALGRSSDGTQFGMFLQVFTDGTVIDSEGVHRLRSADLKPILDAEIGRAHV